MESNSQSSEICEIAELTNSNSRLMEVELPYATPVPMPSDRASQQKYLAKIVGKYFHFTINNWTEDDLKLELPPKLDYLIMAKEIAPTTLTPHLQCYCIVSAKSTKATAIKKLFPNASNIAKQFAKGKISKSIEYCSKEDKSPLIFGVQPPDQNSGHRTDLDIVGEMIQSGSKPIDILKHDFGTWARNYKAIEKATELLYEPRKYRTDLKIIWKAGPTGMGKTFDVTQTEYPDCYVKPVGKGLWFDDYNHETEVLIDEFRGQWPLSDVLQILDNLSPTVERKGSHVIFDPTTIILNSNDHPSTMYENHKEASRQAFFRRLHEIHFYTARNVYTILSPEQRKAWLKNENWAIEPPIMVLTPPKLKPALKRVEVQQLSPFAYVPIHPDVPTAKKPPIFMTNNGILEPYIDNRRFIDEMFTDLHQTREDIPIVID